MEPRILILTSNSYRKIYFANEINRHYKVAGIVVEQKFLRKNRIRKFLKSIKYNPIKLFLKIYYKIRLLEVDKRYEEAEIKMLLGGGRGASFPKEAAILKTDDINSGEVEDFIKKCRPDIILVSGSSLIKKNIIALAPPNGIINMHTGLSPYYRGGPCTFWCLFNGELEYLGVTIHHLTAGIDSGDIILSERETSVGPGDNEATLDCRVIMRGTRLMVKAIRLIFEGRAPRVPQWMKGKNYLFKFFTPRVRLELERRLRRGLVENWILKNKNRSFEYIREVGG